jgi:hypothetical protein
MLHRLAAARHVTRNAGEAAETEQGIMTTPRVTEIPIAMAPVEPDSFIDDAARPSVVERRRAESESRERVRRIMRVRAARSRKP